MTARRCDAASLHAATQVEDCDIDTGDDALCVKAGSNKYGREFGVRADPRLSPTVPYADTSSKMILKNEKSERRSQSAPE